MKCYPWTYDDKVALIGDAAHAIVPFMVKGWMGWRYYFSQDCIDKHGDNWRAIFLEYEQLRQINAIAELAEKKLHGMSSKLPMRIFFLQKKIEKWFSDKHPW
jgi:kynurenine 3-monooxygenase